METDTQDFEDETSSDFNRWLSERFISSNSIQDQMKNVYQELAEKEHALLLAAQFGKNLIEEKENLEEQIDVIRRDHSLQLEVK
jgi:hypothetical protein